MENVWKWWHKAIFYQIYPRSFADHLASGLATHPGSDGIGDLPGIIDKLDYLKDLGIDAIWLSPHYPSPQIDCGYDVSDYTTVDPVYGSMDDFMHFLDLAHARNLRVILDLVLNHTSDQHGWFIESRSSRSNPKSDWYVWKDGKNGGPPNNWYSAFGGSAWEYVPERDQYYYHYFFREQPDLNWRNPDVKEAIFDVARFWLDKGVDGFRLDAIGTIYEDARLPDQEASMTQAELYRAWQLSSVEEQKELEEQEKLMFIHQVDQPGMPELLQELRAVIDEYDDRVLVGETDELAYCGTNMLHLVFNFPLMLTQRLTPAWVRLNQEERLEALAAITCPAPGAWPCNTLGNHDSPRVYNRYGDGIHDAAIARVSLALMLTLRGTPFLYNGEEIGMTDLYLTDLQDFRDTLGIWNYQLSTELAGFSHEVAIKQAANNTRDKNRTPMQWANQPNAGFCAEGVKPWLPINPNYARGVNVVDQEKDPDSLLNFYKRMLHLRHTTPALIIGDYLPLHEESTDYLSFLRRTTEQCCLVVINMSEQSLEIDFSATLRQVGHGDKVTTRLLFSNRDRLSLIQLEHLEVAPFEVLIVELAG